MMAGNLQKDYHMFGLIERLASQQMKTSKNAYFELFLDAEN